MAMERAEYPAMLATLQPGQAVDVLNDRVGQVGKLNTEIANWLQDRRRLEEQYSNGLRKLARRHIDADLGIFAAPWTTLTNSAENLADSHSALANKIEADVERPLRTFVGSNRELQAMTNMQGNLGAIASDVDTAKQKTEKLRSKGDKADTNKVANAISDYEEAQVQWQSQAPYVFESLQAIDESRWNHVRDVLTQFQTHEVDQVEKQRVSAEQVLNQLLNVETADEIKTFALRIMENKSPARQSTQPRGSSANLASSSPATSRFSNVPLAPTLSHQDESASQRSNSIQEPEKKKGALKGLKRLGTVMGRSSRRESKQPQQLAPMAESPERAPRASPFSSFSGRLGRSKENTLEPPAESAQRPRSPLRLGSEVLDTPPRIDSRPQPGSTNSYTTPSKNAYPVAPIVGGAMVGGLASGAAYGSVPNGTHQHDLADLEPPKPAQPVPVQQPSITEPQRDNEGYSLPPSNIDPITQAQQEALSNGENAQPQYNVNIRNAPIQDDADRDTALADIASKLQIVSQIEASMSNEDRVPDISQAPTLNPRRMGTVRGRRDARNSFVPPAAGEQQAQSSLLSAPQAIAPPPTAEVEPTERALPAEPTAAPMASSDSIGGFSPGQVPASTFSPFPTASEPLSPFRPQSRTAQLGNEAGGDNQSIRSSRSLTSTGSQGGTKHPELTGSGLNSSVVETVSARFENGQIISSTLIGEIALAHNPIDFTASTPGTETIRVENFTNLEKVAPNPAFIAAWQKDGEYNVNLANLSRTQVAFKYQLRSETAASEAPLLITPAFRIEATQASIIVSYSLNPSFALHNRPSITLSNVILGLTLEGAKASACLSKPVGTFAREKNLIFWNIGDITLTPGAAPSKLLARFTTETEAKSGSVEARWEISGEQAVGLGSQVGVSVKAGADDPFADEEGLREVWRGVKGVRKVVAGSYVAK
ncbi:Suppressor of Profilin deletion [Oleoguttula sp. CCFEE 5521]